MIYKMKKGIIAIITILVVVTLTAILITPVSVAELTLSNLNEKQEIEVQAPWFPFRGGAIYVFAEGEIFGKGILHMYSNHDRDHQIFTFENEKITIQLNDRDRTPHH